MPIQVLILPQLHHLSRGSASVQLSRIHVLLIGRDIQPVAVDVKTLICGIFIFAHTVGVHSHLSWCVGRVDRLQVNLIAGLGHQLVIDLPGGQIGPAHLPVAALVGVIQLCIFENAQKIVLHLGGGEVVILIRHRAVRRALGHALVVGVLQPPRRGVRIDA